MEAGEIAGKRVKLLWKCPNPLFEKWLEEWLKEAKQRDLALQHTLKKALASLRKFPLPLNSGKECMILEHFGTGICLKLDRKLSEHRKMDGLSVDPQPFRDQNMATALSSATENRNPVANTMIDNTNNSATATSSATENRIPVANTMVDNTNMVAKDLNIVTDRLNIFDKKLTVVSPVKRPRGRTKTTREQIPPKPLMLPVADTNSCEVERLSQGSTISSSSAIYSQSQSQSSQESQEESFVLYPGSFKVILLVDSQETSGANVKRKKHDDETLQCLSQLNTPHEVRHLTVGDFAWVCRDGASRELLLPYVVERKRLDDLAGSIKDGRFHEQKFRLKQLPIQHRIYLVEGTKKKYTGLPYSSLMQAVANTQVVDGFKVKITSSHEHSMQYLSVMTSYLTETFTKKILASCCKDVLPPLNVKDDLLSLMTFKDFCRNTSKKKKFTVGEMFIRHLLQLRGLSVEKAKRLVELYPTPSHLVEAYSGNSNNETMLAKIEVGPLRRSFGPALSKVVHDFYTKQTFD